MAATINVWLKSRTATDFKINSHQFISLSASRTFGEYFSRHIFCCVTCSIVVTAIHQSSPRKKRYVKWTSKMKFEEREIKKRKSRMRRWKALPTHRLRNECPVSHVSDTGNLDLIDGENITKKMRSSTAVPKRMRNEREKKK